MDFAGLLRGADLDRGGPATDLARRLAAREAELHEQEPVIGAAVLTVAAFRLRDEAGLIEALRGLARALADHEAARAGD